MGTSNDPIYEFGVWRLEVMEHRLLRDGVPVPLTPKVFETLLLLIENAGTLVTKDMFMKRVWPGTFVEDLALVQNISQIRKVLVDGSERVIETVPKQGYRFLLPVRTLGHEPGLRQPDVQSIQSRHSLAAFPGSGPAVVHEPAIAEALLEASSGPALIRDRAELHGQTSVRDDVHETLTGRYSTLATGRNALVLTAGLLIPFALWFGWQHKSAFTGNLKQPYPAMVPLVNLSGEERMPALSPDGSRIAFSRQTSESGKAGIYIEVPGTQSLLQVTTSENDSEPAWSPDGRTIAFLRTSGSQFSIDLVPALGGPEKRIFTGKAIPFESPLSLSFAASGDKLAFADWDDQTQRSSIKILALSDSKVLTLTMPPDGYHDCGPKFSPDGSQIAFVRSSGPMFVDDLYIVPGTGGTPVRVTADKRRIFSAPVWSDDGKELIFASTRAGMKSLWRVPATGGEPTSVVGSGPGSDHPTFSSATHEFAYERTVEDENVWRIDLDPFAKNQSPAVSLFSPKTSNLMPQFSPDGTKIIFESDRSGYEEVWMSNSDGSTPVQITKLERYVGSPRWSPDGRSIVVDYRSSLHSGIYTIAMDGAAAPRPVAVFPEADCVVPSWSHDGQWIYFASNYGGHGFHVWKVRANGDGKPLQITQGEGFRPLDSEDGQYVYYTRLTDPRLRKVAASGGGETTAEDALVPDRWANWTLDGGGVYFITSERGLPSQLKFTDLKTNHTITLFTLPRPSFYGLSVIRGGQSAIYSQRDRNEHDIVLLRGFR